jgi:exodeoxyribonuclease V gamma subunit
LRGDDEALLTAAVLADGILPSGEAGEDCFAEKVLSACRPLVDALGTGPAADKEPFVVDVALTGGRIRGSIDRLSEDHLVVWRAGQWRAKYVMSVWVRHLLACSSGIQQPTELYGMGKEALDKKRFSVLAPADATICLQRILNAYRAGLAGPVPFFPKTALAYAESGDEGDGCAAWEDRFNYANHQNIPGERSDPATKFIYKGVLPDDWTRWADDLAKDIANNLGELNENV